MEQNHSKLFLIEPKESISELAYVYELLDACNILGTCINFTECKYFNSGSMCLVTQFRILKSW